MISAVDVSTSANGSSALLLILVAISAVSGIGALFKTFFDRRKTLAESESLAQTTTNAALQSYRAYADEVVDSLKERLTQQERSMGDLREQVIELRARLEESETGRDREKARADALADRVNDLEQDMALLRGDVAAYAGRVEYLETLLTARGIPFDPWDPPPVRFPRRGKGKDAA